MRLTPEPLEKGLLQHLGSYVAAVYCDSNHRSVLAGKPFMVHRLEDPPKITTFAAMDAKYPRIQMMTFL